MNRFSILALAALSTTVSAQQTGYPITTDRPSFSDGTSIIPKGRWQIETGYTNTKYKNSRFEGFGEVLVRFPVSDRLEVRLINVTYGRATGDVEGFLDPSVGIKYKLVNGSLRRPEWTLVAQTTLPAGHRNFRQDETQPTIKLAGYLQLDATTGVGWNAVASSLVANDDRFGQYALSGYVSKTLNARTGAFLEYYRIMPMAKDGPDGDFVDAGITYLLNPATQIDFRIGSAFKPGRDGAFFGFGIAYRF